MSSGVGTGELIIRVPPLVIVPWHSFSLLDCFFIVVFLNIKASEEGNLKEMDLQNHLFLLLFFLEPKLVG